MNTARSVLGAAGLYTAALGFGGEPGYKTVTEEWNGASWTEVADLNTGRSNLPGAGTTSAGLAFGGDTPPITAATEEWSGSSTVTRTLT
jgi:hypothetical protein